MQDTSQLINPVSKVLYIYIYIIRCTHLITHLFSYSHQPTPPWCVVGAPGPAAAAERRAPGNTKLVRIMTQTSQTFPSSFLLLLVRHLLLVVMHLFLVALVASCDPNFPNRSVLTHVVFKCHFPLKPCFTVN